MSYYLLNYVLIIYSFQGIRPEVESVFFVSLFSYVLVCSCVVPCFPCCATRIPPLCVPTAMLINPETSRNQELKI